MLTVEEARKIVLQWWRPLPLRPCPLMAALGSILAEPIVADIDLPPFDKALVDGFAVRASDCSGPGPYRFAIGEEILAGRVASRALRPNEAAVIMTGAPVPDGADAVIMHEKTRALDGGIVELPVPVRPGDGMIPQGREMRAGQTLFEPGEFLDALKLGVLASVGYAEVKTLPRPRVGILPTGDELVSPATKPGPGQIRESNSTLLEGLVRTLHADPVVYPVAPDEPTALTSAIKQVLDDGVDLLLLCGGVSAGKKDLVPAALAENEVEALFHKVAVKPGKPLLFGIWPRLSDEERLGKSPDDWTGLHNRAKSLDADRPLTLVYGLPGNPVSGIVSFMLFVAPVIERMTAGALNEAGGHHHPNEQLDDAELTQSFQHKGERETYHPATLDYARNDSDSRWAYLATPLPWSGSSDLYTVSKARGFVRFPAGDRTYESGDRVQFLTFPSALGTLYGLWSKR